MVSPTYAPVGIINSEDPTPAIPAPPIIGHGLYTVYPPTTSVPAYLAQSSNPSIIYDVITSLYNSFIFNDTPNTINTESMSSIPIEYRSLRTLQQAILPYI
mmetsp:Transcript_7840/g.694  ORF Transcript_7840/g.694 Transcript_7840/m.694 type:complete len:101 (-) Transcript_7840:322-624(-)